MKTRNEEVAPWWTVTAEKINTNTTELLAKARAKIRRQAVAYRALQAAYNDRQRYLREAWAQSSRSKKQSHGRRELNRRVTEPTIGWRTFWNRRVQDRRQLPWRRKI